jgi:hypothetical protein
MGFAELRLRHAIIHIDRRERSIALGSHLCNRCTPVVPLTVTHLWWSPRRQITLRDQDAGPSTAHVLQRRLLQCRRQGSLHPPRRWKLAALSPYMRVWSDSLRWFIGCPTCSWRPSEKKPTSAQYFEVVLCLAYTLPRKAAAAAFFFQSNVAACTDDSTA